MTTVYRYDARNRLTKIEHKDGATVKDSWTYALDKQGNITRTDQADGSYWTYGYDSRYRLTAADRYESTGSNIRAQYAYTYDLGDNMVTKVEPFLDDFEDGNYTGWSRDSGWSAASGYMAENVANWVWFYRTNTEADCDLRFSCNTSDSASTAYGCVYLRHVDGNNYMILVIYPNRILLKKKEGGAGSTLATNATAASAVDTWYRVRVLQKGSSVTVWRGTEDGPMEQILNIGSAPFTTTGRLAFASAENSAFRYDDIEVIADGWTSPTTFAVNNANELTSMTQGGVTTTFAYDAWGQMTNKTRGPYDADYEWRYDHKLASFTSDFPGEGTVTYAYGGDGKRRKRDDGTTVTQYNWDRGWNMINEENSVGTLTMSYVRKPLGPVGPVLAELAGSTPASGTARYYGLDNLGSTRRLWDAGKTSVATRAYTPYGVSFLTSGEAALPGFTGHGWDETGDLYFAPYRYYSPNLSRWLSKDPLL